MAKLGFVSDDALDKAVSHVAKSLDDAEAFKLSVSEALAKDDIFGSSLFSNSIDPFAMNFGLVLCGEEAWLEAEIMRQLYKTYEQKLGEFHQIVLGSVDGWVDLGIGDPSKVDLKKEDSSVFIELKNKYNTCNSDALRKVEDKLIDVLVANPRAVAYWGFIIPGGRQKSGQTLWMKGRGNSAEPKFPGLYKAWGSEVYNIVTGDGDNLERLYRIVTPELERLVSGKTSLVSIAREISEMCLPHLGAIKEETYRRMLIG